MPPSLRAGAGVVVVVVVVVVVGGGGVLFERDAETLILRLDTV